MSETSEEKLKVFISYSRDDSAFADELVSGLEFAGFDVTLDRHSIMEGEDWKRRLGALITDADSVVFLLSPSSSRSAVCQWEVEHAHSLSKRLIPVLVRPLEGTAAPERLAALNYVRFDDGRSFMAGLRGLVRALNTDLDWLREHTRYLQRAVEWDRGGRPRNRLLSGADVVEAKAWAARQPRYAPGLTELQRDFLLASEQEEAARASVERKRLDEIAAAQAERASALNAAVEAHRREAKAERRRRRLRNIGFVVLSLVSALLAALSIVTLQSFRDADRDFTLALLSTADGLLRGDKPTRALVVADALKHVGWVRGFLASTGLLASTSEERVRIETVSALAGRASSAPRNVLRASSPTTALAFSPAAERIAIGHNSGLIVILDRVGGRSVTLRGLSGRVHSLRFSPDGTRLVSATPRKAILWDLERRTGRVICATGTEITDIAFHPGGRTVAWTQRDGKIVVMDLATDRRTVLREHASRALALEFSSDGAWLASSGDDGAVAIRATADWSLHKRFDTGRLDVIALALNAASTRLATASLSGAADLWPLDVEQPAQHGRALKAPSDKRWRIRFSRDDRWLALSSWQGTVSVFDAVSLDHRGTIDGNDTRINDIVFAEKDDTLLTASESGIVRAWSLAKLRPMFVTVPHDARETFIGKYSWDGTKFVAGGKGGTATLFDVRSDGGLARICEVRHANWVFGIAFSHDGKVVYSVGPKEGDEAGGEPIKIWSAKDCSPVTEHAEIPPGFIVHVASSPAGNRLAWASRKGDIWIGDMTPGSRPLHVPQAHAIGIGELDFSPDGKLLVSGGLDGRLLVWDAVTGRLLRELKGHGEGAYIYTVKIGRDNRTIASGGTEPMVKIWNLDRPAGQEFQQDLPLLGGANRLAFSPDGERLAVGSGNRAVSMWRTKDWHKVFQLNTLVGIRSVYGFHPSRGDLAFDGENGAIRIVPQIPLDGGAYPTPPGVMKGLDVLFDGAGTEPVGAPVSDVIEAGAEACGSGVPGIGK